MNVKTKTIFYTDREQRSQIEDYRHANGLHSVSAAIRKLVSLALGKHGEVGK